MILILVGASRHSPNKMSISSMAHKNVFESNVRKWEMSRLRTAESSGNEKKTAPTSLSVLFVIIWAPVGVKTSVLVWQGLGSMACAKAKNWRGLKAAQQNISVVFGLRNAGLAASPASAFGLKSAPAPSHVPMSLIHHGLYPRRTILRKS